ncbi:MAG: TetR family transcriptional regulator [Xanthobacteraceae bacterium]|nr:TetR family transcriptional regulator [Xanthobacteraceae bacterium]QYK45725.1 MAG: TetR family transcriptional regulator [Xanthobacteraceae bacterium]
MARPRAADYDGKRKAILDRSAKLFAKNGYDRTSMAEVAAGCRVSKALLYHYYTSKDELLFDILRAHLDDLIAAVRAVDEKLPPRERLRALVGALLGAYKDADHQHKIQINELSKLAAAKRTQLIALERELVLIFSSAIGAVNRNIGATPRLLKPVTMSLFGMLNWHYMWFREGGAMSREEYADLATQLLIEGAASLEQAKPATRRAS